MGNWSGTAQEPGDAGSTHTRAVAGTSGGSVTGAPCVPSGFRRKAASVNWDALAVAAPSAFRLALTMASPAAEPIVVNRFRRRRAPPRWGTATGRDTGRRRDTGDFRRAALVAGRGR